jgi:hypothetical protein
MRFSHWADLEQQAVGSFGMEQGMFPHLSDTWLIILISCFLGFVIGQWIRARRNRVEKNSDYMNGLKRRLLAEKTVPTRKAGKKARRANKKGGGA